MITITGNVGPTGKYLVTGAPINTTGSALLKLSFENNTAGTNLTLFSGTVANFESGTGGTQLNGSCGPGSTFLTIVDAKDLNGQVLFVRREFGCANSQFTLVID